MKTIQYQKYDEVAPLRIAEEPEVLYVARKTVDMFPVERFQALSAKLPFTQLEWAEILHVSDRTLHRYLKEDKAFEGLYAEHLYQLENMADLGLEIFGDAKAFEQWLRTPREVLGETQDFSTLRSFWGVKLICNELGRMEHGVYI
ncbi:type II RES/Xre toxin-antitoxin system antitoxin [Dyadobacter jiangsuensis]|uniref:Putative toxin-antitoxin system antitoxin component (TIGR02293 family) n=1 Tax=Dyadobacter jiangsuensis TaxID=1591085 RepID=A0A2P8FYF0_9BACT|nr:antitoxin Xre/MbcA/ParS toxin-binding domain-containing protein [Dyadobacter jiangsuensis]PSL26749.1 putative toxin-antitoxin system antitoxin component (TIGR02293 family) [Dyadobacter jiangsuensis]